MTRKAIIKKRTQQPLPKKEEEKIAWTKRNFNKECNKHGKLVFPDTAPVEDQGKCIDCLFEEKTKELKEMGLPC